MFVKCFIFFRNYIKAGRTTRFIYSPKTAAKSKGNLHFAITQFFISRI
jgi:hypothetical protein